MGIDAIEKDIRCPVGRKLFMKLLIQNKDASVLVVDGNLMEFHCDLCTKHAKQSDPSVVRVVHRFNILGNLVETVAKSD